MKSILISTEINRGTTHKVEGVKYEVLVEYEGGNVARLCSRNRSAWTKRTAMKHRDEAEANKLQWPYSDAITKIYIQQA